MVAFPLPPLKIRIMAEEKRYTFTESGFKAMVNTLKAIQQKQNDLEENSASVFYIRCSTSYTNFNAGKECPVVNFDELKELIDSNKYANYTFKLVFGVSSKDTDLDTISLGTNLYAITNIRYIAGDEPYMYFTIVGCNSSETGYCEIGGNLEFKSKSFKKLWLRARKSTDFINYPTDGKTYGLLNGQLELIADPGEAVLVQTQPNAASVAMESLNKDVLVVPYNATPEMMEEVKGLLGEDLFNELAAKSVQTQELKPKLSVEEEIEQAKLAYYERKESQAMEAEERARMALENAEEAEAQELDVLPKKGKEE